MQFNRLSRTLLLVAIMAIVSNVDLLGQQRPYAYRASRKDSILNQDRKINIIKTNLLSFLAGDLNLTYERLAQNAPRSLVINANYTFFTSTDFDLSGGTVMPGIRYYLSKKKYAPAGYYVQPTFVYGAFTVHDKLQQIGARINVIGGGIVGGKQWAIGRRFTVEVYVGGVYVSLSLDNYKAAGVVESFLPEIGGSAGFRF